MGVMMSLSVFTLRWSEPEGLPLPGLGWRGRQGIQAGMEWRASWLHGVAGFLRLTRA